MENYSTPKKMKQVGELFLKYKTYIKAPQATVEKACIEAIIKVTGIKLNKENVVYTVNTRTINLRVPSVLKSELKFKNKEILEELRNNLGDNGSPQTLI